MATIEQIQNDIDRLEIQYNEMFFSYKQDPTYKKAERDKNEASQLMKKIENETFEKNKNNLDKIESEKYDKVKMLFSLMSEEKDKKKRESEEKYGKEVFKIINELTSGIDWGPKGLIPVWISEDGRFFILKNPGHTFWLSMIEPNAYAPTEYILMDKVKFLEDTIKCTSKLSKGRVLKVEGRLTKEAMKKIQDKINEITKKSF